MWTPGRIKISIYHAHEFYKTIKKRGKELYSVCLGEIFSDMSPAKWEVFLKKSEQIQNYRTCPDLYLSYTISCYS
jgi:hypothetical protein